MKKWLRKLLLGEGFPNIELTGDQVNILDQKNNLVIGFLETDEGFFVIGKDGDIILNYEKGKDV